MTLDKLAIFTPMALPKPYPATDGAHPCAGPASFGARHGQKRSASATAASQVAWPPYTWARPAAASRRPSLRPGGPQNSPQAFLG